MCLGLSRVFLVWMFHVSSLHLQVTIVTVLRADPPLPPPPTVERQAVDEVESVTVTERERRRERRRSEERGVAEERRGSLAIPAGRKKRRGKGTDFLKLEPLKF